jgi:predicted anti-sigma-YlaC factor YlaD
VTVYADRCGEFRELASCSLDGEAGDLAALRLKHHLDVCPECVAWMAMVRAWSQLVRDAEAEQPTLPFDASTRRRAGRSAALARAASIGGAFAVAAVGLVLAVGGGSRSAGLGARAVLVSESMNDVARACTSCAASRGAATHRAASRPVTTQPPHGNFGPE